MTELDDKNIVRREIIPESRAELHLGPTIEGSKYSAAERAAIIAEAKRNIASRDLPLRPLREPTTTVTKDFAPVHVPTREERWQREAEQEEPARMAAQRGLTEMMVTNAARFGTEKALEPLRRVNAAGKQWCYWIRRSGIISGSAQNRGSAIDQRPPQEPC